MYNVQLNDIYNTIVSNNITIHSQYKITLYIYLPL